MPDTFPGRRLRVAGNGSDGPEPSVPPAAGRGDRSADNPGDRPPNRLSHAQYAAIADFRHELRRFLAFSEAAAADAGLPAQQHQALLVIAGHRGPAAPTVGLLAERLMIASQSAAELVSRMAAVGLVTRNASSGDRRRTELVLTDAARTVLHHLTDTHLRELELLGPVLSRALGHQS